MKIVSIDRTKTDRIAPLVADFRTVLLSYRNIYSRPDIAAATDEVLEFLDHEYPFFAMEDDGEYIGYIICRTEGSCVWVEHLFVCSLRKSRRDRSIPGRRDGLQFRPSKQREDDRFSAFERVYRP